MKTSIVIVLVFLIYGITALDPYYLKKHGTKTATPISQAAPFSDSITVDAGEAESFNANLKVFLQLKLTSGKVPDFEITLTNPANEEKKIVVSGRDLDECLGKNIDAQFSDIAQILCDEVLEKCDEETDIFYSGNLRAVESFSPSSGDNSGTWTLKIEDDSQTSKRQLSETSGTLDSWALVFAEDIDNDTVPNSVDNCPTTFNPYVGNTGFQADENQNGIGNECECDCLNFKDSEPGKRKICLKLDNWGFNKRFYKGMRKNPGDWAEAVVKIQSRDTFQPGDYSFTNTWLDCHCNEFEILP